MPSGVSYSVNKISLSTNLSESDRATSQMAKVGGNRIIPEINITPVLVPTAISEGG